MRLTPTDRDRLLLFTAAELARALADVAAWAAELRTA